MADRIEETPEFKRAIKVAMETLKAEIAIYSKDAGDKGFAEALALSIAELSGQGTGVRAKVPPEILRKRADAFDAMKKLIEEARSNVINFRAVARDSDVASEKSKALKRSAEWVPRYKLTGKVYLDEQLVDPVWVGSDHMLHETEIEWPGIPNAKMVPQNDIAKKIYDLYHDWLYSDGTPKTWERAEQMRVTAKGLVVHGAPTATERLRKRTMGDLIPEEVGAAPSVGEGLRVPHRGGPGEYQEINILGTIAPPALQSR